MLAFAACVKKSLMLLLPVFFVGLRAACPPGWLTWQDSCYILLPGRMNWNDAFRVCDRPGSAMAMPETQQEQDFIWQEMRALRIQNDLVADDKFGLWIGCKKDLTNPGQLSCPGKKVDSNYTNWKERHYQDEGQDCVRMRSRDLGKWGDLPCNATKFAACEMRVPHPVYCLTADANGRFTSQCLLNHDIKNLTAKGVIGCGQACWAEPRCHSFNIWQQGKICQLDNASRLQAVVTDFKIKEGCSFFDL